MTFDQFLRSACPPLDLSWRKYRRASQHRVRERVKELGLRSFEAYLARLREDPSEAADLANLLRVTLTRFFRERERWEALAEKVLPALIAPGRPLRAWSVGCCGGEEPYTLAILWLSRFGGDVSILATDIDEDCLERAREGAYSAATIREVPARIRERYFIQERDRWRVRDVPRGLVALARHDLMTDAPPEDMDLVLCRYLPFTYFEGVRQAEAARRLWSALRPGGALMVGKKERPNLPGDMFAPWPGAEGVYVRKVTGPGPD